MAVLGTYKIHVTSEDEPNSASIPTHPVEDGVDIADHVIIEAQEVSLEGQITGADYKQVKQALLNARNKGERLSYVGKNTYRNMMIESIDFSSDESIANGEYFSAKLKKINVAGQLTISQPKPTTQTVDNGRKQTQNPPSERYHIIVKGNTYWGLSQKYGTSVSQLQAWNEYSARSIPIGVKVRVA